MITELNKICDRSYQKRPYQIRLMNKIVSDWYGHNKFNSKVKSVLIESPPGSGKTVMGFKLAKMLKEQIQNITGYNPDDLGIGWVVGRRNLLKQARDENDRLINCPDVYFISQFTHNLDNHVLTNYKHKLLVIDEAHHESCNSVHNIINALDPEYIIGLSATPKRTDNAKLCFQKSYKDAGFYTLIDEGWLSQFDHWMIPDWSPKTVVDIYINEQKKWGKSIIYFPNKNDCEKAVSLLINAGIKADLITCETDRDLQIQQFEDGDLDVLVNMFVLTEGFDCPELCTVFVRDSGELPTIQMCGRVLRPHNKIPVSNIVQSINTRWPFVKTANIARRQHVWHNNSWKFIGKSDLIDKIVCNTIRQLVDVEIDEEILKLLKSKKKKKKIDLRGNL